MKKYTGKSEDEILEKIMTEQGCSKKDITYTVLDEKKGFLGIGSNCTLEAYTKKDIKEFIFQYLGDYFTELNQAVSIEIIEEDELFRVILDAENNAIIIGKGGQTLRAITNVLKAAVNNTFKGRINLAVDINHYKEDRYRRIKQLSLRTAKEVRRSHIAVSLEPMPSDERKVIHQYLNDMKNIKTESEGEGNKRHLVIRYNEED